MNNIVRGFLLNCIKNKRTSYYKLLYIFKKIVSDYFSETLLSSILIGLSLNKENIQEILAIIKIIKKFSIKINKKKELFLDIVGTGGDNSNIFNVSTSSIFVISSLGINIIKHGNNKSSSTSGSADILNFLGSNIELEPNIMKLIINKINIGFIYANYYNILLKKISKVRREIKINTIFNVISPLINPFGLHYITLGVYKKSLIKKQIYLLKILKAKKALVVCGNNNIDEFSLQGYNYFNEMYEDKINKYKFLPKTLGFLTCMNKDFKVNNMFESKKKFLNSLYGNNIEYYLIILNSSISLYNIGFLKNINDNIRLISQVIISKLAIKKLQEFIHLSNLYV